MINQADLFMLLIHLCHGYGRARSLSAVLLHSEALFIIETTGVCAAKRHNILVALRGYMPVTWAIEIRNAESERIG